MYNLNLNSKKTAGLRITSDGLEVRFCIDDESENKISRRIRDGSCINYHKNHKGV